MTRPFVAPVSLMAGGTGTTLQFVSDTYIGDLWTFVGSPASPVDVVLIADNCDLGEIIISSNFAGGSTFTFTLQNDARIIGLGGDGGDGGDDNGATGTAGLNGGSGTHAISSDGFDVDLDMDDGRLYGGGGGGGGGAFNDLGASGTPGGGGGGGFGFFATSGGDAGSPTGSPVASNGTGGGQGGGGNGGAGGTSGTNDGGNGGGFGRGGVTGDYTAPSSFGSGRGGNGGSSGNAFLSINGATLNYTGSQTETQLRTSNRIRGETTTFISIPHGSTAVGSQMASFTLGWQFRNDAGGTLRLQNTAGMGGGQMDLTTAWSVDGFGDPDVLADYEVRVRSGTTDTGDGGWDFTPGADGTWFPLSSAQSWRIVDSAFISVSSHFEIRSVKPNGGRLASGQLRAEMEDGS